MPILPVSKTSNNPIINGTTKIKITAVFAGSGGCSQETLWAKEILSLSSSFDVGGAIFGYISLPPREEGQKGCTALKRSFPIS